MSDWGRALGAAATLLAVSLISAPAQASDGEDLYAGRAGLTGRLRGHAMPLPAQASRCANCHEPPAGPPGAAGLGPRLDSATLTRPMPRRGGPATAYDEPSFCRLLGAGVDPAHVLLRREMPVYALSPAQCHALWTFVSQRPAAAAGDANR